MHPLHQPEQREIEAFWKIDRRSSQRKDWENLLTVFPLSLASFIRRADVQGELKPALCTEAPICREWAESPPEFNKRIGSRATSTLGSQFVPEGGVTLESLHGIEWTS